VAGGGTGRRAGERRGRHRRRSLPPRAGLLVRIVYDEQVWALVGSPDGPSAHLVEQITAKARLSFVNPVSTDKSTNLANVPWIFSCAPGDHLIAPLLARALVEAAGGGGIALVSCTDHDSRLTARELLKELGERGVSLTAHLEFRSGIESFATQERGLRDANPAAVAVIAGAADGGRLVAALRRAGLEQTIVAGPSAGRR